MSYQVSESTRKILQRGLLELAVPLTIRSAVSKEKPLCPFIIIQVRNNNIYLNVSHIKILRY